MKLRLVTIAAILAVIVVAPLGAQASDAAEKVVIRSIKHDTSPPLRDILIPAPAEKFGMLGDINPIEPGPVFQPPTGDVPPTSDVQLLFEPAAPSAATVPPFLNIQGLTNDDNPGLVAPPDVQGDVGPNHYMQWNNLTWAVWNKSGTLLSGPNLGNSFWNGFGGPCENTNDGDPVVLHDDGADRWFVTQFVAGGAQAGAQCVAVSATADPLGSYHRYLVPVEVGGLADYPKWGVWHEEDVNGPIPDGATSQSSYTLTYRNFNSTNGFIILVALDRDAMLAGGSLQGVLFRPVSMIGNSLEGTLPPHVDGTGVPFGTCPTFFTIVDDEFDHSPFNVDGVRNHTLCVDWTTPSNSTLTENPIIPGDEIDRTDGNGFSNCVNQPGSQNLDCLALFTMFRAQVRNMDTHLSVVLNSTVDAGNNRSGIYWLEARDATPSDGVQNWTMFQDSTYAPNDGLERWMGSIAMNGEGQIYLGFTATNNSNNPSIRYASRTSSDPPGTLPGGEQVCYQGASAQGFTSRWGDYSTMSVDPSDDCSFWQTHEYNDTGGANWETRICAMDPCNPPAQPTLAVDSGACPGNVTLVGSNYAPNSVAAMVGAANLNGFFWEGGDFCPSLQLQIGQPFDLPPTFVNTDGDGEFSVTVSTSSGFCFWQALDIDTCEPSNTIDAAPAE